MTYEEQLEIEMINKLVIQAVTEGVGKDKFLDFYKNHNQKETMAAFNIRTTKQLTKILKLFNYDFSYKKKLTKGKASGCSHEAYIARGKKSAETQKQNWKNKSEDEKEAWAIKQSLAHLNSPSFKDKIAMSNRAYRATLSIEERRAMDRARSESMKIWWENLTEEEKNATLENRFKNGACYNTKDSKPNLDFAQLLTDNNIQFSREYCLDRKSFDFKVNNILIEIDPAFTHNSTFNPFNHKVLSKNYHKEKTETANKYNARCIHIFDWDDKNKIIALLNANKDAIYARKCEIRPVEKQEAIDFITVNHLQGYAKASIQLGLYYNNKLVSIMTFDKPRYNKNYQYELIRYCASKNIAGGAEKLFAAFVERYTPESVISYCDLAKFTGKTYLNLNFTLLKKPQPSKHWYNPKTKEHYLDSLVRKQGFSRLIHHCDAKNDTLATSDNRELMISAGFVELYDCGQAAYVWNAK